MLNGFACATLIIEITLACAVSAQTFAVSQSTPFNETLFNSSGISKEYLSVGLNFSIPAGTSPSIQVLLGSSDGRVILEDNEPPYALAICPAVFLQGTYFLAVTTTSIDDLSFDVFSLQESAEIFLDSLVAFDFIGPRYFVLSIVGGTEPNLKFTAARIAPTNNTNDAVGISPKEMLIGVNRCPELRCAGSGENSRNTNCGYDARDSPSTLGEGVIRSKATPDGEYYVYLDPRNLELTTMSIIVTSSARCISAAISLIVAALALITLI